MVPSIKFEMPERGGASGFEATFLIDLCNAYVDAFFAGDLHPSQRHIARAARAVLSATAKVGIEALIDEATGHQTNRPGDYLARRLDAFLRREPGRWERAFPPSAIVALCRLYREPYRQGRIPRFLASVFHTIYHVVLGDDVAAELKRRNPAPRFGRNHHQFLADGPRQLLADDVRILELLANQSGSAEEFWARLRAVYRKEPLQLAWI